MAQFQGQLITGLLGHLKKPSVDFGAFVTHTCAFHDDKEPDMKRVFTLTLKVKVSSVLKWMKKSNVLLLNIIEQVHNWCTPPSFHNLVFQHKSLHDKMNHILHNKENMVWHKHIKQKLLLELYWCILREKLAMITIPNTVCHPD